MRFSRVTFVTVAIGLLAVGTAFGKEDELQREIREFHIAHVADGPVGAWGDTSRGGKIRYLIYKGGYEEVFNTLFIQWSETQSGSTASEPVITNRAVNLIKGTFVTTRIVSKTPYTLHVVVGTIYCDEPQSYDVEILDVGRYKIDYLNKNRCEDADTSGTYTE